MLKKILSLRKLSKIWRSLKIKAKWSVADILKEKDKNEKEKKKKKLSKDEKTKEYLKRQDIQEASQVLLDLIQLQSDKLLSQK